eukprot:7122817-Lingulodinium_polyedra.AAC.1
MAGACPEHAWGVRRVFALCLEHVQTKRVRCMRQHASVLALCLEHVRAFCVGCAQSSRVIRIDCTLRSRASVELAQHGSPQHGIH